MPVTRSASNTPARRAHSFGGCRTCRRRHVKCDRVRPYCLACRTVGVSCEGYSSGIRWMPPTTLSKAVPVIAVAGKGIDQESKQETRCPLYTEDLRESMSIALTTDVPPALVDDCLAELDAQTNEPRVETFEEIARGPFGVLDFGLNTQEESNTRLLEVISPAIPDNIMETIPASIPEPTANLFLDSINTFGSIDIFDSDLDLNNTLQWADLFDLNFDNIMMTPQFSLGQEAVLNPSTTFLDDGYATATTGETQGAAPMHEEPAPNVGTSTSQRQHVSLTGIDHDSIRLTQLDSIAEAQFLLKHFQDCVINQMSFMPASSKSPWRILNLPLAVRTLAEMTYLDTGTVKHANAANLYSLFACSAYHLSVNPSADSATSVGYWGNLAIRMGERAKMHMQISLRQELEGEMKAKYKDQLMAILGMLAFAMISGQSKDARCYLLDAERLLRIRGLAQQSISRKARLLHHVYTWSRIVGESTFVLHDFQRFGSIIDSMVKRFSARRSGQGLEEAHISDRREKEGVRSDPRLDDFLRIDPHHSDSDLNIDATKEANVGLHDIHLEDSRHYAATLYGVYGISETWLSLLSQTTRLANILDACKYGREFDPQFTEFLQKRSDHLESMICSHAQKTESRSNSVPLINNQEDDMRENSPPPPRKPSYHMFRAFNSALVLLFYRRIRKVNAWILQTHVDHVIEALREFDLALVAYGVEGPGTAWPAFIAGCEALSSSQRDFLLGWVEKASKTCGLHSFGAVKDVMQEAWKKPSRGWIDISKEHETWVMLF